MEQHQPMIENNNESNRARDDDTRESFIRELSERTPIHQNNGYYTRRIIQGPNGTQVQESYVSGYNPYYQDFQDIGPLRHN